MLASSLLTKITSNFNDILIRFSQAVWIGQTTIKPFTSKMTLLILLNFSAGCDVYNQTCLMVGKTCI